MPNLKFLASTVPEIWRGSQNSKSKYKYRDIVTTSLPRWRIFAYFPLVPFMEKLHCKFEVSSFCSYSWCSGSPKILKVGQITTSECPLTWFCIFVSLMPLVPNINLAKFEVLASIINEMWRGSKNSKSRSRDTFMSTFDHISHFLVSASRGLGHMRAKFDRRSLLEPYAFMRYAFNSYSWFSGSHRILKVGFVNSSQPLWPSFAFSVSGCRDNH